MVTAGTYRKQNLLNSSQRLTFLCDKLLELASNYGWQLQAWAVFSNHYHFVAESSGPKNLRDYIRHLHSITAREINLQDGEPGRKVWFEYWDTHLSFAKSFYARLSYVHRNAVHHKLVRNPSEYPWCSAGWFERRANPAFYRTVMNFKIDRVQVPDAYEVLPIQEGSE